MSFPETRVMATTGQSDTIADHQLICFLNSVFILRQHSHSPRSFSFSCSKVSYTCVLTAQNLPLSQCCLLSKEHFVQPSLCEVAEKFIHLFKYIVCPDFCIKLALHLPYTLPNVPSHRLKDHSKTIKHIRDK